MTFLETLLMQAEKENLSDEEFGETLRAEVQKHMGSEFDVFYHDKGLGFARVLSADDQEFFMSTLGKLGITLNRPIKARWDENGDL